MCECSRRPVYSHSKPNKTKNKIRVTESPRACEIAAALSATDEEIDASIRRPHSICSRRNAFAPICALPPELLSQVFHFCALEELSCYSVQRLGHGHTRISALASSRARRLVAVGQDHGILAQRWVGLPGVVSRAECVALHQHYEHVGRKGTLQVLFADLPYLRAPAPPPVSESRSWRPDDLRTGSSRLATFRNFGR